jgi:hypothetical protein
VQFLNQTSLFNRFPLPFTTMDQQMIKGLAFRLFHHRNQTCVLSQVSQRRLALITVNQNQTVIPAGYHQHRFKLAMAGERFRQPADPGLVFYPDVSIAQFKLVNIHDLLFHDPFINRKPSEKLTSPLFAINSGIT